MYFLHLSLSSAILIDSSMVSLVHVLMFSSRLCVVFLACMHLPLFFALSFSRQLPCFLMVWPQYGLTLASLYSLFWQSLILSSLLQLYWGPTHLFSLLAYYIAKIWMILSVLNDYTSVASLFKWDLCTTRWEWCSSSHEFFGNSQVFCSI